MPGGKSFPLTDVDFFNCQPPLALVGNSFYLLRNAPPSQLLEQLAKEPAVPVRKLSHRLLMHLRKTQSSYGLDWEQLCVVHPAAPQFVFELLEETVRLRLLAHSQRDQSVWLWNGHEWQLNEPKKRTSDKPAGTQSAAVGHRQGSRHAYEGHGGVARHSVDDAGAA